MQPLIGITSRVVRDEAWCPRLVGTRQSYIDAVVQAGGVPIVLPLVSDPAILRRLYETVDGVLFTGGVDVAPERYGEQRHPRLGAVDEDRDANEIPLARWAVADGKPVLGICRGIQLLNVALGGTLYQDIPAQVVTTIDHEHSYKHECWEALDHGVRLGEDSRLAEILGTTDLKVNSLHHQAVKDAAPSLRIVGRAPDGVVEAVEGTGAAFLVGVQCHPEALWQETDLRWRRLFQSFVLAAA